MSALSMLCKAIGVSAGLSFLPKCLISFGSYIILRADLRELEQDGLVDRVQFNKIPPHMEYSLSDKGKDLLPVFYEMTKWGFQYLE